MIKRCLLALLSVGVVSGLLAPPLAAAAPDKVFFERQALASWIAPTPKPDRYRWYLIEVDGYREAREDREKLLVALITGRCKAKQEESFSSISCVGSGKVRVVKAGSFEMDPLLMRARLDMRARSVRYRVEWSEADPVPGIYGSYEYCFSDDGQNQQEGEGHGAGTFKPSSAEGRAFGRRLEADDDFDWSYLSTGAKVTECEPPWLRSFDRSEVTPGHPVEVAGSFSIDIPRAPAR